MRLKFSMCLFTILSTSCAASPKAPVATPSPALFPRSNEAQNQEITQDLEARRPPRLVLWLTIDQLRGEAFERYEKKFGKGGFARLFRGGFVYSQAHYGHAITETAPGHATLFTGAAPREHGIIGNSWLLQDGTVTASVKDESSPLAGPGTSADATPTEALDAGRSPKLLLVPTVGDEMVRRSSGASKVVSISAKDRSAILPAGHAGYALWLGPNGFVSSSYYGELPAWLARHHEDHTLASYLKEGWQLFRTEREYENPEATSPHAEKRLGSGFPHVVPPALSPAKAITMTPFGDAAVLDLAKTALREEALGQDATPDLLSVSLSSTDIIGHIYGPESREMEDQLIRLDEELAQLFELVDGTIGFDNVLVVLSADHGGCESAEHLQELGLPGARLSEEMVELHARTALKSQYGHERFFLGVESPYVTLNQAVISQEKVKVADVRSAIAEALLDLPGVHRTFEKGKEPGSDDLGRRIYAAFHHERSGDIYIVPDPYTLLLQDDSLAATHGSPWSYDTHVPVVFFGAGTKKGQSHRLIDVRSLAPTVAAFVRVEAPPAATFPPLAEVAP